MAESYRILVADDEEVIREACLRILRRAGHEVQEAVDGPDAIAMIRNQRFDLVVLDIKMPIVSGMEVMEVIQQERPEVMIVIITGHGTVETASKAVRAGACGFLTKPFSPNELRHTVGLALNRRSPLPFAEDANA